MKMVTRKPQGSQDASLVEETIAREVAVLKRLKHRNIVTLHQVVDDPADPKVFYRRPRR
jgi:hypothetical protein